VGFVDESLVKGGIAELSPHRVAGSTDGMHPRHEFLARKAGAPFGVDPPQPGSSKALVVIRTELRIRRIVRAYCVCC
jgi:hypothetical protein